jgi:alpha-glucosidase
MLGPQTGSEEGSGHEYVFPGRVLAHQWRHGQRIELTCENATVQIAVLAADLMRVRVSTSGRFPPPTSYAVAKDDEAWPPVELSVEETSDALLIRTPKLHCHVRKSHLAITFLDPDGTAINADAAGIGWTAPHRPGEGERVLCWKQLPPDEHIYGLGEKTTRLDKRGLAFCMWNTDPQFYHPGEDPIYANIPFYLGLRSGREKSQGYGLFFDNSALGQFDFGASTPGITRFEAECGEMRYYFFYGPALSTVLERYTELTGRMIMPPLWALGYHQNRWSYYPEERVREVARQFRERRIPCEAIHLDIDYMDGFRCFTWDEERFPDPAGLIANLHAEGFKVVTMLDPGIKVDPDYWVYADGLDKQVFCTYPNGKPFSGPVWPGECVFPDFTSPRVRAWWGELYREMVDLGVDGFWNDMNEPAVIGQQGDTFPDVVQHEWEGRGADHQIAHNAYGMQMARATVEGLRKLRPEERPLVITRSLWAGAQRYTMHWLGDNYSDWASLRNTVQLVTNMGLSGVAFTGPDTGGFAGTPDGELLIRWMQLGAFTPFFRNHTAKGSGDQEPWAFGETCERISRQYIALRYHLLPYHYTAFWQSAQRGLPIVRSLALAFQDDPHVADIDDQYMYGDAFLVAPVFEPGGTARRLYIPPGRWYDYWTGTLTAGPQIARLDAPIHRLPLLVRAGSIVPAWPAMQHTGERKVDRLILHVYPGYGESELYEDDGHTWAFQAGDDCLTCLASELRTGTEGTQLKITRHTEGPFTPSYEGFQVELHGVTSLPQEVQVDGAQVAKVAFDPQARTASLECGLFHTIEVHLA